MTRDGDKTRRLKQNNKKMRVYSYISKKLENGVLRLERVQRIQRMRRV